MANAAIDTPVDSEVAPVSPAEAAVEDRATEMIAADAFDAVEEDAVEEESIQAPTAEADASDEADAFDEADASDEENGAGTDVPADAAANADDTAASELSSIAEADSSCLSDNDLDEYLADDSVLAPPPLAPGDQSTDDAGFSVPSFGAEDDAYDYDVLYAAVRAETRQPLADSGDPGNNIYLPGVEPVAPDAHMGEWRVSTASIQTVREPPVPPTDARGRLAGERSELPTAVSRLVGEVVSPGTASASPRRGGERPPSPFAGASGIDPAAPKGSVSGETPASPKTRKTKTVILIAAALVLIALAAGAVLAMNKEDSNSSLSRPSNTLVPVQAARTASPTVSTTVATTAAPVTTISSPGPTASAPTTTPPPESTAPPTTVAPTTVPTTAPPTTVAPTTNPPTSAAPGRVSVTPTRLTFAAGVSQQSIVLANVGDGPAVFQMSAESTGGLGVSLVSGSIGPRESVTITVTLNRAVNQNLSDWATWIKVLGSGNSAPIVIDARVYR